MVREPEGESGKSVMEKIQESKGNYTIEPLGRLDKTVRFRGRRRNGEGRGRADETQKWRTLSGTRTLFRLYRSSRIHFWPEPVSLHNARSQALANSGFR